VLNAGLDVLLSTVSLGLWAAVRSTDVHNILSMTIPLYQGQSRAAIEASAVSSETARDEVGGTTADSKTGDVTETPTLRKRGRPRKAKKVPEQAYGDAAYEPTPSEAASITEGDVIPDPGDLDWESTALVWGLTALGGLGVGSAGVMGGECVAR